MDQFHEPSHSPGDQDCPGNQELCIYLEESADLYREARNRFANALLERCVQSGGGRPQSRAAADSFARWSSSASVERKIARGASFLGYSKPSIPLAVLCGAE
jgi:hypothetical protein